ncbi:zincin [Phlegmacium glaucopus]|nr:zincin [Phlegmacium glaucopus]
MVSKSFRNVLLTLLMVFSATSATSFLALHLSGPDIVTAVEDVRVVATIINTGNETLKILNDPRGPLSTLPTNTVTITHEKGVQAYFTGIKVKYVPRTAAAKAYTVLSPGQIIQVIEAYNFTASGEGPYDIDAANLFYIVDSALSITPVYAEATAHTRAIYTGYSSDQKSSLLSAASAAQGYAKNATSYIGSHSSSTLRYTTWFGLFTSSRYQTIASHYSAINSNIFSTYSFNCTCTNPWIYSYVYPDDFGHMYLCGAFWAAPITGTDSKGGTLIHESSHFTINGGTVDIAYGQLACESLAQSNPTSAINNADSHEYVVENHPGLA